MAEGFTPAEDYTPAGEYYDEYGQTKDENTEMKNLIIGNKLQMGL